MKQTIMGCDSVFSTIRSGCFLVFVACGGLIIASVLEAGSAKAQTQSRIVIYQSPRNAKNIYDWFVPPLNEFDEEKNPCEQGNDNRKSDLCAQWKAADAAANASYWTRASFWASLLTLLAAVAAAYYAKQAANIAKNAFSVQTEPLLTVCFDEKSNIKWSSCGSRVIAANDGDEIWFTLKNSGLSPIIVVKICRKWDFSEPIDVPKPIVYGGHPEGCIIKECHIPIGPNQSSNPIRMLFAEWQQEGIFPKRRVYFQGYIVFKDLREKMYIAGFCATNIDGRIHMVLPKESPENIITSESFYKSIDSELDL